MNKEKPDYEIVKERERGGQFKDLEDFVTRLSSKEVNKRTLEALIKAGAFDSLGANRKQLMTIYHDAINH